MLRCDESRCSEAGEGDLGPQDTLHQLSGAASIERPALRGRQEVCGEQRIKLRLPELRARRHRLDHAAAELAYARDELRARLVGECIAEGADQGLLDTPRGLVDEPIELREHKHLDPFSKGVSGAASTTEVTYEVECEGGAKGALAEQRLT